MKKYIAAILLFAAVAVNAQTNNVSTNPPPTSLLPGGLGQLGTDLGAFLTDAQPYFGKGLRPGVFGLYNNKSWGAFIDAQYPLSDNLSVGFGIAYLDHAFYDASISVNYGTTWKVPLIGSVYSWVESGPAYNLHSHQLIGQSFAGITKDVRLGATTDLFITGGVGNITSRPGATYIAGFSLKFKGW